LLALKLHSSSDAAQKLEIRDSERVEVPDDLDSDNFHLLRLHLDQLCSRLPQPNQLYGSNFSGDSYLSHGYCQNCVALLLFDSGESLLDS
jgi:hypothetical protein